MQVKKFEAPTIQEALDTIKRELGPEAIILQTKQYKRGFGLMSKASVEVTAAVSERSLQKKHYAEARLPEPTRNAVKNMPADRQAEFLEKYTTKLARGTSAPRPEAASASGSPVDSLMQAGHGGDRVEVRKTAPARARAPEPEQAPQHRKLTATRYADIPEQLPQRGAARYQEHPQGGAQHSGVSMAEEIRLLKRMVEEMKVAQPSAYEGSGAQALLGQGGSGPLSTPVLQDAYEQLVLGGVDKRLAHSLLKAVAFELGEGRSGSPDEVLDQLAAEIMRTTEVEKALPERAAAEPSGGPKLIALVGPTGVGKTTTVAKLASDVLLKRNLKVGLINLDSYKIAAFDQLGTYAKILNVPFRSCAASDELKAAIQDFQSLDVVLIDTTGRSQRDPESLREMQAILAEADGIRTQLVLAATTRDSDLYDMASRFSLFRPQGIIVSKLDEATIYGAIYNVCQKVKLPLLYFTTGQRVPEDIEEATPERVAALILDL